MLLTAIIVCGVFGVSHRTNGDERLDLGQSVPFDPIHHVQRPISSDGESLILNCSLPLRARCQTGLGKDLHEYCHCGEGLTCKRRRCVRARKPAKVHRGRGIRLNSTAPRRRGNPPSSHSVRPPTNPVPFDPIHGVQRPLTGDGRLILSCSIPLGGKCQTGRGKDMHNYCRCGEGLTCVNRTCMVTDPTSNTTVYRGRGIRIDSTTPRRRPNNRRIVQRPIATVPFDPIHDVQRPLTGDGESLILNCSLPLHSTCQTGRGKDLHNYCRCAEGLKCERQRCVRVNRSSSSPVYQGPGIRVDSTTNRRRISSADNNGRPIVQRPVASGPLNSRPVEQQPIFSSDDRLILACSLPLNDRCQTGRGKDMHSYCRCAEKLKCINGVCKRADPTSTDPVYEGPGYRIDRLSEPTARHVGPIVQRPIHRTFMRRRPTVQRPIGRR